MGRFALLRKIPFFGKSVYLFYMNIKNIKWHKENIKRCNQLIIPSNVKNIYYLGIPTHTNLGDNAQYLCTKMWFAENYFDYNIIELDGMFLSDITCGIIEKLKSNIKQDDLIFFQSGYCTHDLGAYHDLIHRTIVDNLHDIPIIMLPQTVFFNNPQNAERTSKSYTSHGKIFFMARDFTSAKIATAIFPELQIHTYPDIVTTLIGTRKTSETKRDGIIICVRNDSEKFYSDSEIIKMEHSLSSLAKIKICDTTIHKNFAEFRDEIEDYVNEIITDFQKAKVVITDRYHGTIFSLIAGTPVVVVKTTDHKVKTGVEWFNGIYDNYVFYEDSLEKAKDKAIELYNGNFEYQLKPYFKEKYYDSLKTKIEIWRKN